MQLINSASLLSLTATRANTNSGRHFLRLAAISCLCTLLQAPAFKQPDILPPTSSVNELSIMRTLFHSCCSYNTECLTFNTEIENWPLTSEARSRTSKSCREADNILNIRCSHPSPRIRVCSLGKEGC
ncbi:hypothetical protein BDR03DRAFT_959032 [Suillus americanus]|nr:hypothetical protein BDR03DRAFT_959032 [Suillus americanus]